MAKIDGIDFALVNAELLPYIAPEVRHSINEARWDEIRLDVAHHVERWMDEAIARAQPSGESDHARTPTSILRPTAAEAAGFIRTGAIVSLQTVLGEGGITNNFPDVVTSVLPHEGGQVSSVCPVKAADIEFRFHSMPARLLDDRAGKLEDRMDFDVKYPRATPEKALLDWLYLGGSNYTKIAGPPLDLEFEQLDASRLRRLARSMGLTEELQAWVTSKKKHEGRE